MSDFENSYNYVLSRLASMDQAIHRLDVGHYTLDVKVSQLMDRLTRVDARVEGLEDSIAEVYQHSKVNRKEMGRLEGWSEGTQVGIQMLSSCTIASELRLSFQKVPGARRPHGDAPRPKGAGSPRRLREVLLPPGELARVAGHQRPAI
ncbi:uncharacterized protein clec11a [Gymnodraco acuticeps]|uniref:Uncharacterized protein clec11a n=1 Tax=Gymnodraco acuticeps TaxID=8218 RepID=A0A6P8SZ68_GYMAC|nr:uncharacterized protein clec11a [Gymnodraco acuticeps]